jgi:hypothetical protein
MRRVERADVDLLTRDWYIRNTIEKSINESKIRPESELLTALLNPAVTPERVRNICKGAVMSVSIEDGEPGLTKEILVPAWPIPAGSMLPDYLSQYAEQHVTALNDRRFPRCDISSRPSNRLKQLWFLSRALAGASFGVKTRTAINLVGSMRPEQLFNEFRNGKAPRRHKESS